MKIANFLLISRPLVQIFVCWTRREHIRLTLRILLLCIYDELIFEQLDATCTVRMHSMCRRFLIFPHMLWPLILHFSLLFPFFYNLSLFSFCSRVCLSFKLPFSILRSLVSFSCSYFFSCTSMVDYSVVRVDCPSIAFFFARLGCLLESVEGECLKWVSLFVEKDCPYKSVISSLFPLVSHFAKVARSLKMSKVRSLNCLEHHFNYKTQTSIRKGYYYYFSSVPTRICGAFFSYCYWEIRANILFVLHFNSLRILAF